MSYCRFSGDDFQSDVYAYEDVAGGYTIHVAGCRVVYKEPLPPKTGGPVDDFEAWWEREQVVRRMLHEADRVPIGGPHDGGRFNEPDLASFLCRMLALREAGYRVPEYAIEAIRGELTA